MSVPYPTEIDVSEDASWSLINIGVPCMVLAGVSVLARLISRKIKGVKLSLSDYLCVIGLLGAWAETVIAIAQGRLGLGRHVQVVPVSHIKEILMLTYAAEIVYTVSFVLIKLSILLLYQTILPERSVVLGTYVIGAFVILWGVAVLLVSIFSCSPINGFWDFEIQSTCVNSVWFFVGNSIPNIAADIAILVIPMCKVWPMHMSIKSKIAVLGMFLLGGFVIVASTLRIPFMLSANRFDLTWSFLGVATWTCIEINVAVVSASLPTIRPLLRYCWATISPRIRKLSGSDNMSEPIRPKARDDNLGRNSLWHISEANLNTETYDAPGSDAAITRNASSQGEVSEKDERWMLRE